MINFIGFVPDLDPKTRGAIIDCNNLCPSEKGFKNIEKLRNLGLPDLEADCKGSATIIKLDTSTRFFAGTTDKLFELSGGAWNNRSRVGGYTPSSENEWRFAQFGDATIATNQVDILQVSTNGDFADIADAPRAKYLEVASGFVMAFHTNSDSDGWWCSGLYDHTTWIPSQATQAANGRFLDSPGEVIGAKKLGQDIVAYKNKSMFIGRYVGVPIIWSWQQIPGDVGAVSNEAIIDIDGAHLFMGDEDFYYYDGTRPISIGAPVRKWYVNHSNAEYRYKAKGFYDRFNGLGFWYFPSENSENNDTCLIYHIKNKTWGKADRSIDQIVEYHTPGITYDELGDLATTYEDLPDIGYDSQYWFSHEKTQAVFQGATVYALDGSPGEMSITTGDFGDDFRFTTVTQIRPHFLLSPSSGSLQAYYKHHEGDLISLGKSATLTDNKFDILWSSRYHRFEFSFNGACEIQGINILSKTDGTN